MEYKSLNNTNIDYSHLSELTIKLLDQIATVFSLNCISPWSCDESQKEHIGYIHYSNFVNAARQLGLVFTPTESRSVCYEFRRQGLEYIDIDKFVQLIDNKIKLDSNIDVDVPEFSPLEDFFASKLADCYETLDFQKSGKLPISYMSHMLSCFNDGEFNNNTLNLLFRSANLTNKRILSSEGFKSLLMPVSDTAFFSLRLFENSK